MTPPRSARRHRNPGVDRLVDGCRKLRRRLDADRVSVWLLDGSGSTLSVTASATKHADGAPAAARWATVETDDAPPLASLLKHGGTATTSDAVRDGWLPAEMVREIGVSSLCAAALVLDEPVGLVIVEPGRSQWLGEIEAAAAQMRETAALVAARAEAERRGAESRLLLELTEAALAGKSLSDMLAIVCERLARRMRVSRASVHLVGSDGVVRPSMSRRADGRVDLDAWEKFRTAPAPFALAVEAVRTGRPVVAATSDHPLVAGWWQETFDIGASVAFPLGDAAAPVGTLTVSTEGAMRLSADNLRLAAAAAAQLGGFIVRTRAEEEHALHLEVATAARRLLASTAAATRSAQAAAIVADVLRDVTRCRLAATWLVDEAGRTVTGGDPLEVPAGHADAGAWIASLIDAGTLPRLTDPDDPMPRALLVPLAGASGWQGVVVCADPEGGRWRTRHLGVVQALVDQIVLSLDNTRLREAERRRTDELADLASRDPLTGLANRRAFLDELGRAMQTSARVSVLFLDLDRFKELNDTQGHAAGDRLLRIVGRTLVASVRSTDVVARLAGDEFTVLLRDATDDEADALARRLAVAVRRATTAASPDCPIAASVGVASADAGGCTATELLRRADSAMYDEKRQRRGNPDAPPGTGATVVPLVAPRKRGSG